MPTIKDLKFDNKNANRHTEKGLKLLDKSISKLGLGRSILIDKDNNIIAGNGVTEVAGQLGIEKVRIVETTGDEIIAVKRKDLSLDSPQGRALAIADNQTAKVGIEFDESVIEDLNFQYDIDLFEDWEIPKIEPLELDVPEEVAKEYKLTIICADETELNELQDKLNIVGYKVDYSYFKDYIT